MVLLVHVPCGPICRGWDLYRCGAARTGEGDWRVLSRIQYWV